MGRRPCPVGKAISTCRQLVVGWLLLISVSLPVFGAVSAADLMSALSLQQPLATATTSPDGPPRVITLAPSVTELVYAAGAGDAIVGTVLHSDYPPAARAIPRIGDGVQPNDEAILALRPTLVVAWYPTNITQSLAQRLQLLGVPLVYANPQSLDDLPGLIRQLGQRLGTEVQADANAQALQQRIDALGIADQKSAVAGPPDTALVSVFIEISTDPLYTLGNAPLINDLLTRCGGQNPYADSRVAAPQVSVESVLHLSPQVLIVSPNGRDTLQTRTRWWAERGLAAALNHRTYAVDPDWLHRPGPRLVDAAEVICRDLGDSKRLNDLFLN